MKKLLSLALALALFPSVVFADGMVLPGGSASQAANTVLGALTATTPSALAVPSCSGASSALTWTSGTGFGCNTITGSGVVFPVTVSGTTTSGGIPYFSSTTVLTSSALLTQYGAIYGGGAGAAPVATAAGSTGQVLIATTSAAPAFGSVPINGSTLSTGSSGVSLNLATANTWTGTQTLNGTSSTIAAVLANAAEPATNAGAISSPLAFYFNSQSVYWSTTAQTANWTVNFAFSSGTSLNTAMTTGQTMTAVLCALQGATAYYNNVVSIDGTTSGISLFWQGGTAPSTGNASGYDCYSYSILKTGSATYIVLATQTQF